MNTEKVIAHITNWLKDYCVKSGMNGFVVGVSGGIDSAVTSSLCANTGLPVFCLNMPIRQRPDQITLSSTHIELLCTKFSNVQGEQVNLSSSFEQLRSNLPQEIQDELTLANLRSRLRMLTLYAYAGNKRMLVAGTGNKIEDFGIGFFTKYGDGGVDLSPIADLLKSEVYELGKALGVCDDILKAAPTDGLWEDGRTDEDSIGASYPELEWAMNFECNPINEGDLSARQKEVLAIYRKFHRANKHKMEPIPVCHIPDHIRE
jgi:NAD+ synthase